MRLIECHIENFGRISGFDYKFNNGVNGFFYENGWGKSTLASFLKVMFYGFDNEKANKDADINRERNRYMPWQGGTYGGNIIFESRGRRYILTRTFGKKEAEDSFELRDAYTNLISEDYTTDIGEELFNIDKSSFARTIYVGQDDCDFKITDSITAKIGNLAESTSDINNYESAMKLINKKLNEMTPSRKTGSLNKLRSDMARYELMISRRASMEEDLEKMGGLIKDIDLELENINSERERLENDNKRFSQLKDISAKAKEYEAICNEYNDAVRQYNEKRQFFPKDVITDNRIEHLKELCAQYNKYKNVSENNILTHEENARLEYLKGLFIMGVPDSDIIRKYEKMAQEYVNNQVEIAGLKMSESDSKTLETIETTYAGNVPEMNFVDKIISDNDNAENIRKDIAEIKNRGKQKKHMPVGICFGMAALCAVASIILLVNGIMAGAGLLVFMTGGVIAGIISLKNNRELQKYDKILDKRQQDLSNIESMIVKQLKEYNIPYEKDNFIHQIYKIKSDIDNYNRIKSNYSGNTVSELVGTNNAISRNITDFLIDFFDKEEINNRGYAGAIGILQRNIYEYVRLRNIKEEYNTNSDMAKKANDEIVRIIHQYGYDEIDEPQKFVALLEKNRTILAINKNMLDNASAKKTAFEESNNMELIQSAIHTEADDTSMEQNTSAIKTLLARQNELYRNKNLYNSQIDAKLNELDELKQIETELETMREQYNDGIHQYEILKKTEKFLSDAQIMFTSKYTKPIKERFDRYYEFITGGADASSYKMDARINLTVEDKGVQHNSALLSMGIRNLMSLCMRIAIVDIMYKEEKPFIILDDPFVNFDDDKIKGAIDFVNHIGETYQIIYFTCHNSRSI